MEIFRCAQDDKTIKSTAPDSFAKKLKIFILSPIVAQIINKQQNLY